MTRGSYLFGLAVLSVFFLAPTPDAQGRDQFQSQRAQYERRNHTDSLGQQQFLSTTKRLSLRIPVADLSKRGLERRIRSAVKKSGCVAAAQDDLSMGCITGCMRNNGVSVAQLASCGAICTVNLVGCAVCAGVSEWIVLACTQFCAWRGVIGLEGSVGSSGHPRHFTKRLLKPLIPPNLQNAS